MSVSLLTRTIDGGQQAVFRLRDVLWAITQAAAAAALAWYIAHNLLGHPDPFFAPIAAAGAISASNVLHVQRAIQNISGVALGIIVGAVAQLLLGTESIAIALAVFVSLCVAVLVGHGFLGKGLGLGNQAAGSAVLVAALSGGDQVVQRLQEALIGSGVALAFTVLLFPVNPLTAPGRSCRGVGHPARHARAAVGKAGPAARRRRSGDNCCSDLCCRPTRGDRPSSCEPSAVQVPLPEIACQHFVFVHRGTAQLGVDHILVEHRGGLAVPV